LKIEKIYQVFVKEKFILLWSKSLCIKE